MSAAKKADDDEPGFLARASACVDRSLMRFFTRLGTAVGRSPKTTLLLALIVFAASMSGITQLENESRAERLWAPQEGNDVKHLEETSSYFSAESRRNGLLVVSKNEGENILTANVFKEIRSIMHSIEEYNVSAPEGLSTVNQQWNLDSLCTKNAFGECSISNIVSFYPTDAAIDAAASVAGGIPADLSAKRDMGMIPDFFFSLLGGLVEDANGVISSAAAMNINIELDNRDVLTDANEYIDPAAEAWELGVVEDVLKEPSDQTFTYVTVYPNMQQFTSSQFGNAIRGDLAFVGISIMLIAVYLVVQLGNCTKVGSRMVLSIAGLSCIGFALGTAYGIGGLFAPAVPVTTVLPFLLAGIGVDDAFVIINEFDLAVSEFEKKKKRPVRTNEEIAALMGAALGHAGSSITITSLTNLLAFLISSTTVLPALSSFCIWAGIGIAGAFLYTCTVFSAGVVLDARRQAQDRMDCCCCIKYPFEGIRSKGCCGAGDSEETALRKFIRTTYAPFLMNDIVRGIVVFVFLAGAGACAYGITTIQVEFRQEWFLPGDSFLQEYYRINREFYGGSGTPVGIYARNFSPYEKVAMLDGIEQVYATNTYIDYTGAPVTNWFQSFKENQMNHFGKDVLAYSSKTEFDNDLATFLSTPNGTRYASDIIFSPADGTMIEFMRTSAFYRGLDNSVDELNAQLTLIADCDQLSADNGMAGDVYAFSFVYTTWRQFEIVPREARTNVLLAIAAVFVVLVIFVASVQAACLVTLSVALVLVDVLGIFTPWGLFLDSVSVIQLALAVGLAVDFSAHIGHAFMHKQGTTKERAIASLADMGVSVINGAFSTFLAVCLLSASKSYIFVVFFKTFFATVVLGAGHGLIFLPVLLSLLGPPAHPAHDDHDDAGHVDKDVEMGDRASDSTEEDRAKADKNMEFYKNAAATRTEVPKGAEEIPSTVG